MESRSAAATRSRPTDSAVSTGIRQRSSGPLSERTVQLDDTAYRLHSVAQTTQTRPSPGVGASHAVVGHLDW